MFYQSELGDWGQISPANSVQSCDDIESFQLTVQFPFVLVCSINGYKKLYIY